MITGVTGLIGRKIEALRGEAVNNSKNMKNIL